MNCKKCGKLFRSQHAFRFCPECGSDTHSDQRLATLFHIPVWLKHSRPVQLGTFGIVGIVAICTVAAVMRPGSSSPEKAIEQLYDYSLSGSYGGLKDSVPTQLRKEIMSDYGLKSSYVKEQWQDILESDDYMSFIEEVDEVEIRILKEKNNLGTMTFDDFCDYMSKYDTRKDGFDAEDITEARYVEYRITLMDENGDYLERDDETTIAFKYKGRWYLMDAVETFEEICKSY